MCVWGHLSRVSASLFSIFILVKSGNTTKKSAGALVGFSRARNYQGGRVVDGCRVTAIYAGASALTGAAVSTCCSSSRAIWNEEGTGMGVRGIFLYT